MDPPTNMEVREVKADSITLTWRNPTNQQYRLLFVRYKTKQETDWKYVRKAVETVSLSGLELDTEYEIKFTAKDEKGSTVGRDIVTAVTGKTTMNTPTNVEVKEVKADSMEFTWRDPTNQTFHFLFVEYRMKKETDWTSVKKAQERVSLSGLELDTEYEIKVTAIGDQGSTVSRNTVTAVTAKGTMNPPTVKGKYCSVSSDVVTAVTKAISPPTNLEVKDMTKDSITLTWVNPSGQQCQSVLVEYRTEEENEWACKPVKNQETVTLSGLKPDTEYEIRVTVKGKGCSVSSDVVTAVTAKNTMSPPTNVEVKDVKANSLRLTWKNSPDQECRFLIVEYKMKTDTEWTESDPVKKNQETATLSGLELDTEYEIRVTAMGKQGCSASSDVVTAVTAKTTMNPPTNVEVKEVKADSITLTWRNSSDQECRFLTVEYKMKTDPEWIESDPVKKTQETATLSGLELNSEYEIRVTAVGKQGCSVSSDVVTAVTAKTTMNPPTNVEVKEVKADSITLTWKNSSDEEYRFLTVEYKVKTDPEWIESDPVKKTQETATLSGLELDTEYEIRVTAVGKQGCSASSDVVTAVTAKTTMNPPTSVEVKDVKADSITLTWRNPSDQEYRFLTVEYKVKTDTEWIESDPVKKTQETATLSGLELDTEYEIRVTAMGKQGCSASSDVVTAVTAKTTMNPPTNVEVKEVKADSITLTWRNPSDQEYRFLTVQYKVKTDPEWIESDPVKKNEETATLSGLELDTEYEIRVTAVGKQGCSVSSDIVSAVTVKTNLNPPTNVEIKEVKADSITLTWKNSSDEEYQFLMVEYKMKQDREWLSQSVQTNQERANLSGLVLETEYELKVTARGKGSSVSSDVVTAVTAKTTMNPPTNVEVKDVKADSITLTWRNPSDQECRFLIVEYKMKQDSEWIESDPVKKNQETATLSGLKLDTEYEIRVTAVGKQGCSASSDVVTAVTVKYIISPPTNVKVKEVKANSITLTWSKPKEYKCLKQYIIDYKMETRGDWDRKVTSNEACTFTLENLEQNTPYSIRMVTETQFGMSEPSEEIETKTVKEEPDKNRFTLHSSENPCVYLLNLETDNGVQLRKRDFGKPSSKSVSNRTIMLVGATGSGKTTLINGMINYVLGVDWEDNWRFKLIDEETNKSQAFSQTSEVTAYQIYCKDEFQVPYSLTLIDTPGFGDTRGIKQDKEITERIRKFFTNKGGIDSIDAVCFVVQAALARLTHTQRYIFESILSVFGKNIASNIITLVTFADGKSPPVLEAIREANIPCATQEDGTPVHFKFNNSVLFSEKTTASSDIGDFDYMFWKMGMASMKTFFDHLDTMDTKSLSLTKQVLEERKQLGTTVEGVQPLIRKGLSTMEEIRTTQAVLDTHKTQIEANKDFEYEVEVEKADKIEIPIGSFITNCHQCNYTCHFPCGYADDKEKMNCCAMKNGSCTVCPGKCVWSVHYNMKYRWETKRVKEKRTYNELKSKYEEAMGEKMNTEQIVTQLQVEYDDVKEEVGRMMNTVSKCLARLKEIALRPDPLSTPDYIDLLIEAEKADPKPGWKQRIQELEEVRQSAVLMQNVKQSLNGELPDNDEEESVVNEESVAHKPPAKKAKGLFNDIWNCKWNPLRHLQKKAC